MTETFFVPPAMVGLTNRLLAAGLLVILISDTSLAQSRCRAADNWTSNHVAALRAMLTSVDEEWSAARSAYQLPSPPDTAIVVVADSATCHSAAEAYNAALPVAARVVNRSVYVLKIGSSRFVVWDKHDSDGLSDEFEVVIVFDQLFAVLARFAS